MGGQVSAKEVCGSVGGGRELIFPFSPCAVIWKRESLIPAVWSKTEDCIRDRDSLMGDVYRSKENTSRAASAAAEAEVIEGLTRLRLGSGSGDQETEQRGVPGWCARVSEGLPMGSPSEAL